MLVEGQYKAKMTETRDNDGYFSAILEQIEDTEGTLDEVEEEALVRSLKDVFETYVKFYPKIGKSLGKYFSEKNKLSFLVNQVTIIHRLHMNRSSSFWRQQISGNNVLY